MVLESTPFENSLRSDACRLSRDRRTGGRCRSRQPLLEEALERGRADPYAYPGNEGDTGGQWSVQDGEEVVEEKGVRLVRDRGVVRKQPRLRLLGRRVRRLPGGEAPPW
jgi:hypothetical protein